MQNTNKFNCMIQNKTRQQTEKPKQNNNLKEKQTKLK